MSTQHSPFEKKKHPMKTTSTGLALTTALAFATSGFAQAPAPTPHHPQGTAMSASKEGGMMAECQAMKAKHHEMMDKQMSMDATLDKLVTAMNAAAGDKKADAMEKPMAAVLNELVAQRKTMHAMMMEMEPKMMDHMMRHMEMQGEGGGMKGMSDCPMMKMDAPAEPSTPSKH